MSEMGSEMISTARQLMVLLVSQPGIMHKALYSILQSLPDAIIMDTNGALTAYDFLERQRADVVVIDANIPLAERVALLARLEKQFPQVRTIVLTTTKRHHQVLREAGAELILMQNCSRQDIETAVLSNNGDRGVPGRLQPRT
jgi:DNA-binding NarL/FixJ family response regulator